MKFIDLGTSRIHPGHATLSVGDSIIDYWVDADGIVQRWQEHHRTLKAGGVKVYTSGIPSPDRLRQLAKEAPAPESLDPIDILVGRWVK